MILNCVRVLSWTLMIWCQKASRQTKPKPFCNICQRPGAAGKQTFLGKFQGYHHQLKTWSSGTLKQKLTGGQMRLTTIVKELDVVPQSTRQSVKRTWDAWLDSTWKQSRKGNITTLKMALMWPPKKQSPSIRLQWIGSRLVAFNTYHSHHLTTKMIQSSSFFV